MAEVAEVAKALPVPEGDKEKGDIDIASECKRVKKAKEAKDESGPRKNFYWQSQFIIGCLLEAVDKTPTDEQAAHGPVWDNFLNVLRAAKWKLANPTFITFRREFPKFMTMCEDYYNYYTARAFAESRLKTCTEKQRAGFTAQAVKAETDLLALRQKKIYFRNSFTIDQRVEERIHSLGELYAGSSKRRTKQADQKRARQARKNKQAGDRAVTMGLDARNRQAAADDEDDDESDELLDEVDDDAQANNKNAEEEEGYYDDSIGKEYCVSDDGSIPPSSAGLSADESMSVTKSVQSSARKQIDISAALKEGIESQKRAFESVQAIPIMLNKLNETINRNQVLQTEHAEKQGAILARTADVLEMILQKLNNNKV